MLACVNAVSSLLRRMPSAQSSRLLAIPECTGNPSGCAHPHALKMQHLAAFSSPPKSGRRIYAASAQKYALMGLLALSLIWTGASMFSSASKLLAQS